MPAIGEKDDRETTRKPTPRIVIFSYLKFMFGHFQFADELLDNAIVFGLNVIDQTSPCVDIVDILNQFNAQFGRA